MFPITTDILNREITNLNILDITSATIRQVGALASAIENVAAEPILHLEMGNPGLPAEKLGIEAQCEALRAGIPNTYPNIAGIPAFKDGASRFLKAFLDVDIPGRCIVPTVGSMQGCFTTMLLLGQRIPGRDTIVFVNPGFPAQHHQCKILGLKEESFDLLDFRGDKLEAKLRSFFEKGNVTAIIYSNPNNPAWTCLTPEEPRGDRTSRNRI